MVLFNGGFKYVINTSKGRMGERMLRRLRYELSDRILRFPILQVRKVKQAEVATMIKDEIEPLGRSGSRIEEGCFLLNLKLQRFGTGRCTRDLLMGRRLVVVASRRDPSPAPDTERSRPI